MRNLSFSVLTPIGSFYLVLYAIWKHDIVSMSAVYRMAFHFILHRLDSSDTSRILIIQKETVKN